MAENAWLSLCSAKALQVKVVETGAPRYKFPKQYRLLKREQFLQVQSSPHRVVSRHLVVLYLKNSLGHVRVGFTVSKKHGKAVQRNRLKRVLRAAVRQLMPQLHLRELDMVVIPRSGALGLGMRELHGEFGKILKKLVC